MCAIEMRYRRARTSYPLSEMFIIRLFFLSQKTNKTPPLHDMACMSDDVVWCTIEQEQTRAFPSFPHRN